MIPDVGPRERSCLFSELVELHGRGARVTLRSGSGRLEADWRSKAVGCTFSARDGGHAAKGRWRGSVTVAATIPLPRAGRSVIGRGVDMATQQHGGGVLDRLAGKRLVFSGKFDWG